jgi:biopolymer transport protein ExbD
MRFPRNAKVFRGQLDMAPFVSVFFLLLVFEALTALIRTPGAPMRLSSVTGVLDSPKAPLIEVLKTGEIRFGGRAYQVDGLEVLRTNLQKLPRQTKLRWALDPAAPKELVALVAKTIHDTGLPPPAGDPIQLPAGTPSPGVAGRVIVVAIDFAGQLYYDDQPIQEGAFRDEMARVTRKYSRDPAPTLVLLADGEVSWRTLARLADLAEESGVKNVSFAMREKKGGTARAKKSGKP